MKSINTEGTALICSGEDNDPASPTVASGVVHWSRPLTTEELATAADYLRRIEVSAVNPREGQERYGEALTARSAWIESLPRDPARTWKNVYFVRPDRRLVEVTGLQNEDTIDAVLAHARHSARADEHEIDVLYTDDTRERFAVRPEDRPRAD